MDKVVDPWYGVDQCAKLIESMEPDKEFIESLWEGQFRSWMRWVCWFRHAWIYMVPTKLSKFIGTYQKSRLCSRCGTFEYL